MLGMQLNSEKTQVRRALGFLLATAMILSFVLALTGCGGGSENGVTVIPVEDICKEFEKDSAAANEKYKDQVIAIKGVVSNIIGEYVYVGKSKTTIYPTAMILDLPSEDVAGLSIGDKITVSGTFNYGDALTGITMYDCYIGTTPPVSTETEEEEEAETPVTEDDPTTVTDNVLTLAQAFSESTAWVQYTDASASYATVTTLIDKKGKVLYTETGSVLRFYPMKDGVAYYVTGTDANKPTGFVIVDSKGKKLYTYKYDSSKDTERRISGYGGGVFVYTEHTSNINDDYWTIGTIDKNGKETGKAVKVDKNVDFDDTFTYFEKDLFQLQENNQSSNGGWFFDPVNGTVNGFFKEYPGIYYNANLYQISEGTYVAVGMYNDSYQLVTKAELLGTLQANSGWTEFSDGYFLSGLSGYQKTRGYGDGILCISAGYFDSSMNPILNLGVGQGYVGNCFSEGYAPIVIQGADGGYYFTIIDKEGKQQFEPLKYPNVRNDTVSAVQGGYVIVTLDQTQQLLDLKGKVKAWPLTSANPDWEEAEYQDTISDGFLIAYNQYYDAYAYVSLDGKTVIGKVE